MLRYMLLLGLTVVAVVDSTYPMDSTPALIFDMGLKSDKSFNEAAHRGAEAYSRDTGVRYREFEIKSPEQREQALRRLAQHGADPIVSIGFEQASAVEKVALEFPETRFAVIDTVVELPNVKSLIFKEHEGSFLVGALAAMASESGKIGFVGGMDVALIRRFACGYAQGARYIEPDIEVFQDMAGTTPAAWKDPVRGAELAMSQFDRGVDVIYAAAGATGTGVYQAAKDNGKLAIGVDVNQNDLHPGTMLTSMQKRVDLAVYKLFKSAREGTWTAGTEVMGLAEGGVEWTLDQYNQDLVTASMRATMDKIQRSIISGEIQVHDYLVNHACQR